jgi:hypothetical protein
MVQSVAFIRADSNSFVWGAGRDSGYCSNPGKGKAIWKFPDFSENSAKQARLFDV